MLTGEEFLYKYSRQLNDNQLKAVQTVNGPVLLLAVPGSGKTTVLVNRLGYMLYVEGISPSNILTLTYTIEATKDMTRRFESMFGEDYSGQLEFRTINGICAKIIVKYGQIIGKTAFELVSEEDHLGKIITDILAKHLSEYPTESDVKGARTLITYCKNMMLQDEEIEKLGNREEVPLLEIFKDYNAYLRFHGLMDYDDQMIYAYRILKGSPKLLKYYQDQYKYICVDEAQDTSKIQHIIIGLLAGTNGNLFMVGDEDQSIYGFRAAYPEALLNFEKDHPGAKVLVMNQNYRSNAKIVDAADCFIQHNTSRHEKHMIAMRGAESDVAYIDVKTRANQYGYLLRVADRCNNETAVLYRDNESAIPLVDLLERQNIPYRIRNVDMTFFTHRVVNDVTNILKFALNPKDTELFMRIYFKCQTYLKKSQAERLCRVAEERGIDVLNAVNYVSDLNGMVLGKCRGVATNLRCMVKESPSKALFRIENPMGYGEYLERNGGDGNKLLILQLLANNESTLTGFLKRLEYLQDLLKNGEPNYKCPFILSTIHSSKGLEYDRVFLMDVFDGLFPAKVMKLSEKTSESEKAAIEEERRLFYVGMTRAKNNLAIFRLSDSPSCLIKEITSPVVKTSQVEADKAKPIIQKKAIIKPNILKSTEKLESDYELCEGELVVSVQYEKGVVTKIEYGNNGSIDRFEVEFDDAGTKKFLFPNAFQNSMRLLSGAEVKIRTASEEKEFHDNVSATSNQSKRIIKKKNQGRGSKKNTYAYWESEYPEYVVVKHEGFFWTCRGDSAETIGRLLGYKLGGSADNPITGSPSLDDIVDALRAHNISYIVVDNGEIIEKEFFE